MIRYYGTDYKDELISKFEYFRNAANVNPSAYSTRITNVTIDSRYSYLRDNSRNAAVMANSHVCNIQGVGLDAINDISAFYDEVDRVSEGIYRDACLYYDTLDELLTTVNNLCGLLNSSRQGGSLVTVEAINEACVPLVSAKINNGIASLGLLCAPPDEWDPSNEQAFRDAMAAMGITDLTDEEIALLAKIYVYLIEQGFTPEEIMAALPYIYNSPQFDQMLNNPYVAGNADAFARNLEGIADSVGNAGNLSAFNYLILVDNLIDENGDFNPEVLEAYRAQLIEMGISDVSDEDILAYIVIVEELKKRGYSDEEILAMTADIYASDLFDAVNDGVLDTDALDNFINTRSEAYLREHFSYLNGNYSGDFWSAFEANASAEDKAALVAFYQLDPDSVSPEEYRQAQIDALILLVNCLEGYSENGYNHTAFNCWYCGFDKEVEWCGIFCSWALTEVGLAGEGPYALQGVNGPMNDITSWGSYAYNFGNINNHGQHINGDSIYDSGNNFYAENDRVHTADEVAAGEYVPQVGDIVVTPGGSGNGHVCILIAINDDGTYETMDGNAGSDCDEVSNKHNRTLDGIVCFCDNHSL